MHLITITHKKQWVGVSKHRTAVQVWNIWQQEKGGEKVKPKNTDNTDPSYTP